MESVKKKQEFVPTQSLDEKIREKISHKKFLTLGIIIIILILIPFLLSVFNQNNIQSIQAEAEKATDAGNYDKAIALYTSGLASSKNSQVLLTGMIKTLSSKGNATGQEQKTFASAEPYINQVLTTGSADPTVLQAVGYANETAGNYQDALTYYQKVTQLSPNSATAWFELGHSLEFLDKRQEAYADYEKAFALDPNQPEILMAMGNIYMSQGRSQDAFDAFIKASQVPGISNTSQAEALTAASTVRGSQEDFKYIKEALALSNQAVNADPNSSPALSIYGYNLYLTQPTTDEGFTYMKKAITANPRISKNYYLLGLFYRASKDYINAEKNFQQAASIVNQDNTLLGTNDKNLANGLYLYNLAKTYSLSGSSIDTLSLVKQALSLNPSLKTLIKSDVVRYGVLKELQTNQDFINLVNS